MKQYSGNNLPCASQSLDTPNPEDDAAAIPAIQLLYTWEEFRYEQKQSWKQTVGAMSLFLPQSANGSSQTALCTLTRFPGGTT